jgi:hypothetical protein
MQLLILLADKLHYASWSPFADMLCKFQLMLARSVLLQMPLLYIESEQSIDYCKYIILPLG